MKQKLYDAERDTDGYENTVMKHMLAMTTEGLHSKSAIAVELAYRDKLLADTKQRVAELEKELDIYATNFEDKARRVKELEQYENAYKQHLGIIEENQIEIQQLTKEKAELKHALQGMLAIVADSRGVAGYHLNGNTAEWDEFDEVDAAQRAIEGTK